VFDPCPRCRQFKTRFEPKLEFTIASDDKDYLKHASKRDFARWNGVKVCRKCWRILNKREHRFWAGYNLVKMLIKVLKMRKEASER